MEPDDVITEPIRRAVERSFPPEEHRAVLDALAPVGGDYMRAAVLALAFGDKGRLLQLAEEGRRDYRDVLIQLDYAGGVSCAELARRYEAMGLTVPDRLVGVGSYVFEADVKRFLAEELIVRYDDLRPSSRLQQDLGAGGAKGRAFMAAFAEQFGVDLTGFQPDRHFGPASGPASLWAWFLLWLQPAEIVPITVEELVDAARSRRWPASPDIPV